MTELGEQIRLLRQAKGFSQDRERFLHWIRDAEQRLSALEERMAMGDDRKAIVKKYVHPEHLTGEMAELLIDRIYIGKRIVR